jgi:sugar phosphate isomerase/epimerase
MNNHSPFSFGVSLIFFGSEYSADLHGALLHAEVETVEINAAQLATESQRATVKKLLETQGLRASSLHSLFGSKSDYSSLVSETWQRAVSDGLQAVEIAAELDIPIIVAHASAEPILPEERSRRFERAVEGLALVGKRAQASGRRIAIEYLPRTCLGNHLDELISLLDRLDDDTFGVCLDVNHLMGRYVELPQVVRALGKRLIATHISDCDALDEKHWLPGKGVLDWPGLIGALREIGYTGPFTYECEVPGDTPAVKLAALKENFTWLITGASTRYPG